MTVVRYSQAELPVWSGRYVVRECITWWRLALSNEPPTSKSEPIILALADLGSSGPTFVFFSSRFPTMCPRTPPNFLAAPGTDLQRFWPSSTHRERRPKSGLPRHTTK